jgi:ubiquinone/menaquinone biosynthesis C-methylase UbiE
VTDDRIVQFLFKLWSSFYDQPIFQRPFYRRVHAAVLKEIDLTPVVALDLGCGTGQLTEDLVRRFPRALVTGVDLTHGMLAAARRRVGPSLPLVRGNVYALPVADRSVDLLTSTISYHWYLEPRRALAEVRRVVRPGGRFVLATMATQLLRGQFGQMRLATASDTEEDLRSAGFRVDRRTHVRPGVEIFVAS